MTDFFYNDAGRLRSVWRVAVFAVAFLVVSTVLFTGSDTMGSLLLPRGAYRLLFQTRIWMLVQSAFLFVAAALIGWGCARMLEDLPWASLGWALHRGWLRDLLVGTLLGGVSICVAALVGAAAGGYSFSFAGATGAVAQTFVAAGIIFMAGAAAEEMLFRGYALQTLMRSWPVWVALLPLSLPFALVHLLNPNVAPGFTFVNTALAGVWLGVAYWRTRSLWFPTGLHFGWNWVQGAVLGSPVSGLTAISPDPLLRYEAKAELAWLVGGSYGIEGGAACTLALVISTLFIWRTGLLKADPELRQYTDGENPNPQTPHVTPTLERR